MLWLRSSLAINLTHNVELEKRKVELLNGEEKFDVQFKQLIMPKM